MSTQVQGLNNFLNLNVPASDGFGSAVNVNDQVSEKAIYIAGTWDGEFVIYATHDGTRFAPVAVVRNQNQQVRETIDIHGTYQQIMVFRRAFGASPIISLASRNTCAC